MSYLEYVAVCVKDYCGGPTQSLTGSESISESNSARFQRPCARASQTHGAVCRLNPYPGIDYEPPKPTVIPIYKSYNSQSFPPPSFQSPKE